MATKRSNLRVRAHWLEDTVFAGEEVTCLITFENVGADSREDMTPRKKRHDDTHTDLLHLDTWESSELLTRSRNRSSHSLPRPGHRAAHSLSSVADLSRAPFDTDSGLDHEQTFKLGRRARGRSVSIISLGNHAGPVEGFRTNGRHAPQARRSSRKHSPSTGMLFLSHPAIEDAPSSPIIEALLEDYASTTLGTEGLERNALSQRSTSPNAQRPNSGDSENYNGRVRSSITEHLQRKKQRASITTATLADGSINPATLITPSALVNSQERATLSRDSAESESFHTSIPRTRRGSFRRGAGQYEPPSTTITTQSSEDLMMGYAQITGSFTVDSSLVNQAHFEEVKHKAVVGGHGGGVVGIDKSQKEGGMFQRFGWSHLGESLSGLLGGSELSSIKEIRDNTSSRSIPLLSTPQSILFVDLKLEPGESRTYRYSLKLPRGLPPTHRGRAMKTSYNLKIGTQKAGGASGQQVKFVEFPFQIMGSVNNHGELLGHDLMSPYIILRDDAHVEAIDDVYSTLNGSRPAHNKTRQPNELSDSGIEGFLQYAEDLMLRPRENSSFGLLSPTARPRNQRYSIMEEPASMKEAIDMAIMRSNLITDKKQSANRFEITRNGQRVAVVMLARPAYRLGETITAVIDFSQAQISCYAIHASLETTELVDSSLALRSEASIHRVTRKVHASYSESTLFARRVIFTGTIPSHASPSFVTSGISLEWRLPIEFVTPRDDDLKISLDEGTEDLLEEISRDDRGVILAAVEKLDCESFEIAVPVRVYGVLGVNTKTCELEALL